MQKREAQEILNRMKAILAAEFPEYTAKFGKTKFDTTGEISFKFDLVSKEDSDAIANRDNRIGLAKNKVHPEAIGMEFEFEGKTHVVESVRPRKQKFSVVARREDGKAFRFPAEMINEKAFEQFGTKVRYIGNTAILDGRN